MDNQTIIVGREYAKLQAHKGNEPTVPEAMREAEMRYCYDYPDTDLIYKPIYDFYGGSFWKEVKQNTKNLNDFGNYRSTARVERFMLNAYQFSAAKTKAEAESIQSLVFGDDGLKKSFSKFRKEAEKIATPFYDYYWRVEYDSAVRQTSAAEKYDRDFEDRDLYPYWWYSGRLDARERTEHREMEGKTFEIGDPEGDKLRPPIDWNCRCLAEQADETDVKSKGYSVLNTQQAAALQTHAGDQFRYNPATQGPMTKKHSYFDVLPSANDANADMFALEKKDIGIHLAAKGMHGFLNVVEQWKNEYNYNRQGDVVFQNKRLLTNVFLTQKAVHKIGGHAAGSDFIPETIQQPSEVWALWKDHTQMNVYRAYILFGAKNYVVLTLDGIIQDAFIVPNGSLGRYRKGCIL